MKRSREYTKWVSSLSTAIGIGRVSFFIELSPRPTREISSHQFTERHLAPGERILGLPKRQRFDCTCRDLWIYTGGRKRKVYLWGCVNRGRSEPVKSAGSWESMRGKWASTWWKVRSSFQLSWKVNFNS